MTLRPSHFTRTESGEYLPTTFAQSHWGDDHLNGPAVVGLAATVLEHCYGLPEFLPARLTVDLFKAAKGVTTTATTRLLRNGRRVRNSECEIIQDGVIVARATLVQYRRSSAPAGEEWTATTDFTPPAERDDVRPIYVASGASDWSQSIAEHQNTERKRMLNRAIDVISGQANTPFVNAAVSAEGTSLVTNLGSRGVGYINGDLTVALARLPLDEWIGVQADSHWTADGVAIGTATLFDHAGPFGSGLVTAISNPAAQIDFAHDRFPSRTP